MIPIQYCGRDSPESLDTNPDPSVTLGAARKEGDAMSLEEQFGQLKSQMAHIKHLMKEGEGIMSGEGLGGGIGGGVLGGALAALLLGRGGFGGHGGEGVALVNANENKDAIISAVNNGRTVEGIHAALANLGEKISGEGRRIDGLAMEVKGGFDKLAEEALKIENRRLAKENEELKADRRTKTQTEELIHVLRHLIPASSSGSGSTGTGTASTGTTGTGTTGTTTA